MNKTDLIKAVRAILDSEDNYAKRLQARGEFGRSKLAWAAISGVESALQSAAKGDDANFAVRLKDALNEQSDEYRRYWDDEDGVGTSTFNRVLGLVE